MVLTEVKSRKDAHDFLMVADEIYRNDPVWVSPLHRDIESIFDPGKNSYFNHGEATRWVLKNESGKLIGRIASFIDYNTANTWNQPTGRVGFFECIDDIGAAVMLFDAAKEWLLDREMEAMDGPVNFGETDKYWGLLVEGYTHPSYEVAYNPQYYRHLFEDYGFKLFYGMTGYHYDLTKKPPERFMKIAEWITKKPGYRFEHFSWKRSDTFVCDFADVYNRAWKSFKEDNFKPLSKEYIKRTLKKTKAVIDEEFIWIAYFEDKPVAVYMQYPDVNMIFKYFRGKMNFINKIRFLILKKRKKITRIKGLLMGVIPEFRGKGIESGFMYHVLKALKKKPQYHEIELSWVADYNPRMLKIFESLGAAPSKKYITYRYLFDRTLKFERRPNTE